jgi:hypothetical protein
VAPQLVALLQTFSALNDYIIVGMQRSAAMAAGVFKYDTRMRRRLVFWIGLKGAEISCSCVNYLLPHELDRAYLGLWQLGALMRWHYNLKAAGGLRESVCIRWSFSGVAVSCIGDIFSPLS